MHGHKISGKEKKDIGYEGDMSEDFLLAKETLFPSVRKTNSLNGTAASVQLHPLTYLVYDFPTNTSVRGAWCNSFPFTQYGSTKHTHSLLKQHFIAFRINGTLTNCIDLSIICIEYFMNSTRSK